jgi:hypothetical protein
VPKHGKRVNEKIESLTSSVHSLIFDVDVALKSAFMLRRV